MPLERRYCPTIAVLVTLPAIAKTSVSVALSPMSRAQARATRKVRPISRRASEPALPIILNELHGIQVEPDQEEEDHDAYARDVSDDRGVSDPAEDVGSDQHPCEDLRSHDRDAEPCEEQPEEKGGAGEYS